MFLPTTDGDEDEEEGDGVGDGDEDPETVSDYDYAQHMQESNKSYCTNCKKYFDQGFEMGVQ